MAPANLAHELRQASFRDICSCIVEFFRYEELQGSLVALTSELASESTARRALNIRKRSDARHKHADMLRHFDRGDQTSFFSLWQCHPLLLQTSEQVQKLEFWLQLYFAIYPALIGQPDHSGLSQTLPAFRQYLDTNGMLLARDPHLLSYYALPYVHDPQSHPSFAPLFTPAFITDLRLQLTNLLQSPSAPASLPRLYSMYAAAHKTGLPLDAAAIQPEKVGLQPFLSLDHTAALPNAVSQSSSRAVLVNSRSVSRATHGTGRLFSGTSKGSSRPLSALLNGSKELADLVSVSQPRYADHLQMPSLEPSAEILHVAHPEAGEGSLSPESSSLIGDHSHATKLGLQDLLMRHAETPVHEAASTGAVSQPSSNQRSQACEVSGQSQYPGVDDMALRDAVRVKVNDSTEHPGSADGAFLHQPNSSIKAAFPSGSQEEAQPQLKSPLKLLAASRSRHSRLAAAAAASSLQESRLVPLLAQACQNTVQLQHVSSIGSSGGHLAVSGSHSATEEADGGQATAAAASAVRLTDSIQAGPTLGNVAQRSGKILSSFVSCSTSALTGEGSAAVAEPSVVGQPDAALTNPADSTSAPTEVSATPVLFTQLPSSSAATEGVCTTHVVHDDDAAAPMTTALILSATCGQSGTVDETATKFSIASRSSSAVSHAAASPWDDPLHDTAAEVSFRSRSSSAAGKGTGNRQSLSEGTARASPPGSRRTSAHKAADNAVIADLALQSDSTDASKTAGAVMDGHTAKQQRRSSSMGAAEVVLDVEPVAQRSVATRAEGVSGVQTSATSSRRSSASGTSSGNGAQSKKNALPQQSSAFSDSLQPGNDLGSDGHVSVTGALPVGRVEIDPMGTPFSRVGQREGSPMGTPLSQSAETEESPAGTSLSQLAETLGSPVGTSSRLARAEGNPMGTSLSQLGREGGGGVIRHSVILTGLDPLDQWLYRQPGVLASLDFDKVKTDLQDGEAGLTVALLQSLRWRLDKAATASDRCQVLASYIDSDILQLRKCGTDLPWSSTSSSSSSSSQASDTAAIEQWTCLIGALAGMHGGRAYLCSALIPVVQQLCHWLQAEQHSSQHQEAMLGGVPQHALEALHRLSLRREARQMMVEHGIIRWLARQLSHADTLPLSSLECYGALLMNLAMCKPGREECQQLDMLVPLESLLEHDSMRVQTYANAILYSLLRSPGIRQSAQEKGMDAFLQHVQQHASPVIARQIACVLKHWHRLEAAEVAAEEDDGGLDNHQQDDDSQDAQIHVGDDAEEAESIHSWDGLHGERLLASRYLQDQSSSMQASRQTARQASVSIQDMGAVLNSSLSQSLVSAGSQAFGLEKMPPSLRQIPGVSRLNSSGVDVLSAEMSKLIPVAKQEEYIAAFGSQTKLPRTPLLPDY